MSLFLRLPCSISLPSFLSPSRAVSCAWPEAPSSPTGSAQDLPPALLLLARTVHRFNTAAASFAATDEPFLLLRAKPFASLTDAQREATS